MNGLGSGFGVRHTFCSIENEDAAQPYSNGFRFGINYFVPRANTASHERKIERKAARRGIKPPQESFSPPDRSARRDGARARWRQPKFLQTDYVD